MSLAPDDLILVEDHSRPIATQVLSLAGGSLADPPGKEGLAFLTGQMLMRGTKRLDQAALSDEIDYLGSSLSVGTGRQRMTVSGDALTRNLDAFQGLIAEILTQPAFDPAELEKIRRITLAELAQVRDNDAALGQRFFLQRLFAGHPYGRPSKGTEASLSAITIEDVRAFFATQYAQQDAVVAVAGDLDAAGVDRFVSRTLAQLPQQPSAPRVDVPSPALTPGHPIILVDKPERSQTQVFTGHVTIPAQHPDFYALFVAHTLFGGTFTARLSQEIREKRGWSYGAYSYLSTDQHLGTFTMRYYPSVADTPPALALADQLLRTLCDDGADADEVEFSKNYLVNSHPFSIDTPERRMSELLGARLAGRDRDFVARFQERIGDVTATQVSRAVREHLHPDSLVTAIVATASDLEDTLKAWPVATSVELRDYREDPSTGAVKP